MVQDRVKIKKRLNVISNANVWKLFFIVIFIVFVILVYGNLLDEGKTFRDYIELNVIISFFIAFGCEWLSNVVSSYLRRKTEDKLKETTDYKTLSNKYMLDKYANNGSTIHGSEFDEACDKDKKKHQIIIYPIIILGFWKDKIININFKGKEDLNNDNHIAKYSLPVELEKHYDALFDAHRGSNIYNCLHARVNEININEDNVDIEWEYTTYFDSLLTNRAIDYPINNILTVREMYEPGPFISSLKDSKLSNHLGFNGLIEIDNKLILIKRCNNVSIGKGLWQTSTNSSFKVKYGVIDENKINRESLSNAIKNEIRDELRIEFKNEKEDLCDGIFAFYRDLVEGGKPQFLYSFKIDTNNPNCITSDGKDITCSQDILKYFKSQVKGVHFNKNMMFDGNVVEFIDINDLANAYYDYNFFRLKGSNTCYKMTPSNIVSILLLLERKGLKESIINK